MTSSRRQPLFLLVLPWAGAAIVLLAAVLGAFVTPYDPLAVNLDLKFQPPNAVHWMGTDYLGRDVLSRVIAGAHLALRSAALILVSSAVLGIVIGLISGYYGGVVDEIFMRLTDIFIAFPGLILAMAIAAALGPNLDNAMLAIAAVWWPPYARLIRAQVLTTRERDYITAARGLGANDLRILFLHILPNVIPPFVVQIASDVGPALVTTSSLSFIGMGAQPPTPEWGSMVSDGRQYLLDSWWMSTFPGAAIFVTVLVFNAVSESLRRALELKR